VPGLDAPLEDVALARGVALDVLVAGGGIDGHLRRTRRASRPLSFFYDASHVVTLPLAPMSSAQSLQGRVDAVDCLNDTEMSILLMHIVNENEVAAAVYVYDKFQARGLRLSDDHRAAFKRLDGGRTAGALRVPYNAAPHLEPSRRIHKICKGWRLSERNDRARKHIDEAIMWVREQQGRGVQVDARSSAGARMRVARQLASFLNINIEVARGIVTTLKRKKAL